MGADNFRSILLKQVIGGGVGKMDNNLDEHHACIISMLFFVR